jgi:dolichol-phosphate mannosyltransferase
MKHKQFVSAVAYIHDAAGKVEKFLKTLYGIFDENFEEFEIICVNDSSADNSSQLIREFASTVSSSMISMVNTGFHQGVEAAMLSGLDLAIGDFVFEFDDVVVNYEPDLIMQCYDRCLQGFDIVSCGIGGRQASSKIFYSIYNRHSGTQYDLKSETFRVVSRRAINRVYSMSPNPIYRKALYRNCGLKTDYLEYKASESRKRKRERSLKNPYDTALTSLLLFTNVAYKATLALTILAMLATLGSVGYVVTVFILGNPVEGFTTMMILLSSAFFAIFAILAMVIKYLSVLLRLAFQRQRYVLESVEKLTG